MMMFRLVALLVCAGSADAQVGEAASAAARGGVEGSVRDSLSRAPLVGATVQLVNAEGTREFFATAESDSSGRYVVRGVADGRYLLGFLHPLLDSLGLAPPLVNVVVAEGRMARADLGTPSGARYRTMVCGPPPRGRAASDSGALVLGMVRDARSGAAVVGASIVAEWVEFDVGPTGAVRRIARRDATARDDGLYALCDVPSSGILSLRAKHGMQETDRLELRPADQAFVRRDLYLGPATEQAATATTPRTGEGLLRGTVVASAEGRPVPNAVVRLVDGTSTRSDSAGRWTLAQLPLGTRMLEVRAVGFAPERRVADVRPDGEPVAIVIGSLGALLDTVRVLGAREDPFSKSGFAERQRSSPGRFITRDDIIRRRPIVVTDLLYATPGVRVERNVETSRTDILVRGAVGEWCAPSIYVDGAYYGELDAEAVDSWVRPTIVRGIEVYTGSSIPPQFNLGLAGPACGSIVIWTR